MSISSAYFTLVLLLYNINVSSWAEQQVNSGFYVDNGMGMTEMEFMDLEDQNILREEMLALLGLTRAPNHNVHKVDRSTLGNQTIPHFMREIYKSLTGEHTENGEIKPDMDYTYLLNNQFGLTMKDIRTIDESDIIMSFANHGHQEDLSWTQLFWFDTTELPNSQEQGLLRAELRLYKGTGADEFDGEEGFVVKCYQLVEGSTGEANLLDSIEMKFKDKGWLILDLTRAVRSWQLDYHTNQGLMVEIVRKDNAKMQLHPAAIGLATSGHEDVDKEANSIKDLEALPG